MAAATENRSSFRQVGETRRHPMVAGAEEIFKGTLVNRDALGNALPAADTAAFELYGVATENVVAATGDAAGANVVKVWTRGNFEFEHSGLDQGDVGAEAFVVDDQTVALAATTTNDVFVGRIIDVPDASTVVVALFVKGS
jgi:hypothetical protein